MALILFLSALLLGAAIVWRLRLPLYPFEAVALAIVLGLFGWIWLAFLAALVLPYSLAIPLTMVISVGASVALCWDLRRRTEPLWRPLEGGWSGWIIWGVASLATTVVLGRLYWTHSLVSDSTGVYSAGSTWADYGFHASFVSHFAVFDRIPLDLPVASGTRMTYPFLIDFLSAMYLREGWGLHLSLFLPGLLLALACCQLLMSFSLRLFGHAGAAAISLGLVLLLGSAAGARLAYADWQQSGQSLLGFLSALPRDYTALSTENGQVTNLVANAMLPGRSILFGLGVGLCVLILLHSAREIAARQIDARRSDARRSDARRSDARRYLLIAGVLIGLLPMAHPHTFLVSGAVLGALAIEAALRLRRPPWAHLAAGGLALGLAVPQLMWQQLANGSGTGGRVRIGWMQREGESIWAFWWTNFGVMGIFFIALPLLLIRPALRHYLVWYLPFLAILGVAHVYAFQPFEYDNVKLIYYVYLMAGLFAGFFAVQLYRASRWNLALLLPVGLIVAMPGLLSITHEFQMRYQFASTADVALAGWVRANTAPDDVFIATDRPNQPIATLGGRSLVMGYRGWLYAWNLSYAQRETAVAAVLQGRIDDPMVRRFDPDYLAVGVNEGQSWPVDRTSLAHLPVVYQNAEWTIYRVTGPSTPAGG